MGRTSTAKERLMEAVTELIWTGSYGSTSVDQICARAGVTKGSFYHFFESKAALAEEALQAGWEEHRATLDRLFSPTLPPLERIRRFCQTEKEEQAELKRKHGFALGCPLMTLGTEISTLEAGLCRRINEMMSQHCRYFESAIRDAHAQGVVDAPDAAAKAQAVHVYIEGLLAQARIRNDVEVLQDMERGILDLLGVRSGARSGA